MTNRVIMLTLACAILLGTCLVGCDMLIGPTPSPPVPAPQVTIDGPSQTLAGDMNYWSVGEGTVGDTFHWRLQPDVPFMVSPDGRTVSFAKRAEGYYTWILVTTRETRDGLQVGVGAKTFLNTDNPRPDPDPGPNPGPGPGPNPGPGPIPPDPNNPYTQLRQFVSQSYTQHVRRVDAAEIAQKLGMSMLAIGKDIAAGKYTNAQTLRTDTELRNREAIGWEVADELEPWASKTLGPELAKYASQVRSVPQLAPIWEAVGNGLLDAASRRY